MTVDVDCLFFVYLHLGSEKWNQSIVKKMCSGISLLLVTHLHLRGEILNFLLLAHSMQKPLTKFAEKIFILYSVHIVTRWNTITLFSMNNICGTSCWNFNALLCTLWLSQEISKVSNIKFFMLRTNYIECIVMCYTIYCNA